MCIRDRATTFELLLKNMDNYTKMEYTLSLIHILNGKKYYLGDSGVMYEGWKEIGHDWYYFYPGNGELAVNTTIDGFYVDGSGIWRK